MVFSPLLISCRLLYSIRSNWSQMPQVDYVRIIISLLNIFPMESQDTDPITSCLL